MQAARLPLRDKSRDRELAIALGGTRRSVSEKAPMQSQFSECPRFGRSRIEEQRRRGGMQMRYEREFIDAQIDAGKFCVVSRPAFGHRRNNCA
jgi:hypothetical protein